MEVSKSVDNKFNEYKIKNLKKLATFKLYTYHRGEKGVFCTTGILNALQRTRRSSQKNKYFSHLMSESEKEKNKKYSSFSMIVFFDKCEKKISVSNLGSKSYDPNYFKSMLKSQLYVKKIRDNWEGYWFLNPYGITRWSLESNSGTIIAQFSDNVSNFFKKEDMGEFIKRTNLAKKYDLSQLGNSRRFYPFHED